MSIVELYLNLTVSIFKSISFIPFRILFEFHDGFKLLYTGDYRLSKDDWIACDMLKDPLTRWVFSIIHRYLPCENYYLKILKIRLIFNLIFSSGFKRLDALYFDSTFCRRGAENIPTLKQSCALCVRMVKEWLEKDSNNKVLLWCGE